MAKAKSETAVIVGEALRRIRTQKHLSQTEVFALTGIPKARLSRYENGHVEASLSTLRRFSVGLDVPMASILVGI